MSYAPVHQATDVGANSIVLTFNEQIQTGYGNVTLTPNSGIPVVFDITDETRIVVSQATVTVNISETLLTTGVLYTVTMDAGAVRDYDLNNFAGISGSTYTFNAEDTVGALGYTARQSGYFTYNLNASFPNGHSGGETVLRSGGSTIMLELRADYWLQPLSTRCTTQLLSAPDSQQPYGWSSLGSNISSSASSAVVTSGIEAEASILRIDFSTLPTYNISTTEVIAVTIPAECVASNYNYGIVAELSILPSICEASKCKSGTCQESGGFCKCPYGWGGFDCNTVLNCQVNGQCAHSCPTCTNEYVASS